MAGEHSAPPPATSPGSGDHSASVIAARLDRLPVSRWHRRVVVLIGLGSFCNLFEISLSTYFGVLLGNQWTLSTLQRALIIAALFPGEMIGSIVLAPLADRLGRRTLFQVNLLTYAVLSLATAFAPNLATFLVLRMCTGIGLGAELTLVDTYLGELLPAARRGRYLCWAYTVGLLAAPVAGGLATAANTAIGGLAGWRWLLILSAVGGLAVWLLRRRLPESPRWLAATGNTAEADRVLTAIEREVRTDPDLSVPATVLPPVPARGVVDPPPTRPYRRRNVLMWVMQIISPIGFYAFASIAPIVLLTKGFDLAHSLTYSALSALGCPLGSLASVYLTERFERRTLLIAATLAVAAFGVMFGLATTIALVIVAGVATTISTVLHSNFTHIYQAELFHTANRSTAIGVAYAASRLVGAMLPLSALTLLSAIGSGGLYACCALLLSCLAIAIRLLGPRTNNQQLDTI